MLKKTSTFIRKSRKQISDIVSWACKEYIVFWGWLVVWALPLPQSESYMLNKFFLQRRLEKYEFVLVCSYSTAAVRNIFSFLRQILRLFDNYHFDILIILGPMTKKMLHRLPLMENAQIRYMTNGPESFTPDSRYLLGEVPEVGTAVATNFIQRP